MPHFSGRLLAVATALSLTFAAASDPSDAATALADAESITKTADFTDFASHPKSLDLDEAERRVDAIHESTSHLLETLNSAAPKTKALCDDLDYLHADAKWSMEKLTEMQDQVSDVCEKIGTIVDTCDKIVSINKNTKTCHTFATPLSAVPYAGPVVRVFGRVCKIVSTGTDKAKKCQTGVDRLKLRKAHEKCPKIEEKIAKAVIKLAVALHNAEDARDAWCHCAAAKTTRSDVVQAGCEAADEADGLKCRPELLCPLCSNAKALAAKYSCIESTIESASNVIDQDVAAVKNAIAASKKKIEDLKKYFSFVMDLDSLVNLPRPAILKFWDIVNPLLSLIEKLEGILGQTIKITVPGCEEQQLTREELSRFLQINHNMTLAQAMAPIQDYKNHPYVLKMRQEFADNLQYHELSKTATFGKGTDSLASAESKLEPSLLEDLASTLAVKPRRRLLSKEAAKFGHIHVPHRHHIHVPHRHHIHVPHRHHIHVPHRHHIHVPHRHHFHASKVASDVAKTVGNGVVSAVKAVGDLVCYSIEFSVMDILNGIGNMLEWMTKPIEAAMKKLFNALGITLPEIPGLPNVFPDFDLFEWNWDTDFLLTLNWIDFEFAVKLPAPLDMNKCASEAAQMALEYAAECDNVKWPAGVTSKPTQAPTRSPTRAQAPRSYYRRRRSWRMTRRRRSYG
jgi:hypothetical protein